jgi:ABC transporter substrate binding protein
MRHLKVDGGRGIACAGAFSRCCCRPSRSVEMLRCGEPLTKSSRVRYAATLARGKQMQFDRLRRREFITLLGSAATNTVIWPVAAHAQKTAKVPRIGYLGYSAPPLETHLVEVFQEGLRNIGYVDGQSVAIEYRSAEGALERLPALANELVGLNVDIIVTLATPGALAAKQATNTVPIVVAAMADPAREG